LWYVVAVWIVHTVDVGNFLQRSVFYLCMFFITFFNITSVWHIYTDYINMLILSRPSWRWLTYWLKCVEDWYLNTPCFIYIYINVVLCWHSVWYTFVCVYIRYTGSLSHLTFRTPTKSKLPTYFVCCLARYKFHCICTTEIKNILSTKSRKIFHFWPHTEKSIWV
jgi:hypothetical protein